MVYYHPIKSSPITSILENLRIRVTLGVGVIAKIWIAGILIAALPLWGPFWLLGYYVDR